MKENILIDLSKQFAVDVVNLCTEIKEHRKSNVLLNQLLRSGTSIGANIHEANYASSKAEAEKTVIDFMNGKLTIIQFGQPNDT